MVGDSFPVYHCKYALVSNHECNYCICNNCYEKKSQEDKKRKEVKTSRSSRVSRMKRKRSSIYDDEEDEPSSKRIEEVSKVVHSKPRKCMKVDHEVVKLNVCCDAGYFSKDYVTKKLNDKDGNYPITCNECGASYMN